MDTLINEFNEFFNGDAQAVISDGRLKITIGSRTLVISLPDVAGIEARGL